MPKIIKLKRTIYSRKNSAWSDLVHDVHRRTASRAPNMSQACQKFGHTAKLCKGRWQLPAHATSIVGPRVVVLSTHASSWCDFYRCAHRCVRGSGYCQPIVVCALRRAKGNSYC
ncbi:hypothetical protein ACOSP7_019362 [Xanthoceras sorbifolium]